MPSLVTVLLKEKFPLGQLSLSVRSPVTVSGKFFVQVPLMVKVEALETVIDEAGVVRVIFGCLIVGVVTDDVAPSNTTLVVHEVMASIKTAKAVFFNQVSGKFTLSQTSFIYHRQESKICKCVPGDTVSVAIYRF